MSKTKMNISPSDITKNWKTGMTNNVPKIVAGINAVTENPMVKAADAGQKMAQKLMESVTSGRHRAGCEKVSLQDWKTLTATKTQARLAQGVEAATNKHQNFANWLAPRINGGLSAIAGMPDFNLEDSIARQAAWTRYMAAEKYKK